MSQATLDNLQAAGLLDSMDLHIAGLVSRMKPEADAATLSAAALASRAIRLGHACADLADYAGKAWAAILQEIMPVTPEDEAADGTEATAATTDAAALGALPALADWIAALDPALFGTGTEQGTERTLFVRKDSRVYLRRYWDYERTVEHKLVELNRPTGMPVDVATLSGYFKPDDEHQQAAARKAIENRLSLLSGGPGTGKTYTLARAVALRGALRPEGGAPLCVHMVAPTGKAAARMVESLKEARDDLRKDGKPEALLSTIPEEATTIHRLLGATYQSPYFKHDAGNPIAADMVIVDEASMVDLPLMAKLLDALPPDCSLMLVGDIDQLASVEPGRVYGDVCRAAEAAGPLDGCLTRLTRSRRFPDDSAIGTISRQVNAGAADAAWEALQAHGGSCHLRLLDAPTLVDGPDQLTAIVEEQMAAFLAATEPEPALAAAGGFRILCALRNGPYGVKRMNRRVEQILSKKGLKPGRRFYDHQLIMIRVNTPALNLYNGDAGVVLARPGERNAFDAWFPDAEQGVRPVPVNLLPDHETAFAMTVHKSQGSQFPCVALILPDRADTPVLTRELLYTGMTRVAIDTDKQTGKLLLWCTETSFKTATTRRTARSSGLFSGDLSA